MTYLTGQRERYNVSGWRKNSLQSSKKNTSRQEIRSRPRSPISMRRFWAPNGLAPAIISSRWAATLFAPIRCFHTSEQSIKLTCPSPRFSGKRRFPIWLTKSFMPCSRRPNMKTRCDHGHRGDSRSKLKSRSLNSENFWTPNSMLAPSLPRLTWLDEKTKAQATDGHTLVAHSLKNLGVTHVYCVSGTPIKETFAAC